MFRKYRIFTRRRRIKRRSSLTKHYREHRALAELVIQYKVRQWNAILQLPLRRITIRNQRSRWGSCSEHGNLNFNYKLIFLPEHLLDYVVVHELCHLQQLNHSPAFWSLVAQVLPDYQAHINELRSYEKSGQLSATYLEQYRPIIDRIPES